MPSILGKHRVSAHRLLVPLRIITTCLVFFFVWEVVMSERAKGVRIEVLRDLLKEAQEEGLTTTSEVCNGLIKPRTEEKQCAYVDTLPSDLVADATVFVSHAWRYDLADSVDVMEQYEAEHPGSVFWFDLVMNNQHGTAERPVEW